MYWFSESLIPCRPRTLGPLGDLQGTPPGRRVPAGRIYSWGTAKYLGLKNCSFGTLHLNNLCYASHLASKPFQSFLCYSFFVTKDSFLLQNYHFVINCIKGLGIANKDTSVLVFFKCWMDLINAIKLCYQSIKLAKKTNCLK